MSIIRNYNNLLINLSKAISIRQRSNIIYFHLPISNYFYGYGSNISFKDTQPYSVEFKTEQEATEEYNNIKIALTKHYNYFDSIFNTTL